MQCFFILIGEIIPNPIRVKNRVEMPKHLWYTYFGIIIFIDRTEGTSKMSSGIFGEAFWGVLKMKFRKIRPRKQK